MHHPQRRNVTTSMDGLKKGYIRKSPTQSDEFQRYSWERRRRHTHTHTPEMPYRDGNLLYVYMYIITVSCWCRALQPRSCPPFYPDSVCPELARSRIVWKWPSIARIRAFRGDLQARLWQTKIGLWSFVTRFTQAAHRVAQENQFALWEVRHAVLDLRICTKQARRK